MLVKCHALCDPTGLAAADSDGAPSEDPTGEKCVIDCAAARMHGESFVKGANERTVAAGGEGGEGGEGGAGGAGAGASPIEGVTVVGQPLAGVLQGLLQAGSLTPAECEGLL